LAKKQDNSIKKSFSCSQCSRQVPFSGFIGTEHRNHCPFCLWSKHVDLKKPGDRKASCLAKMKPIGLTFKREGTDKYGILKQGELMLIHECLGCDKISINRIAGDDSPERILNVFQESQSLSQEQTRKLKEGAIELITPKDKKEVFAQLFGKTLDKDS